MTSTGNVLEIERTDGLVVATINRPERRNAIDAAVWQGLRTLVDEVEADPADRALLLTGAGGDFSSGADLSGGMGVTGGGGGANGGDGDGEAPERRGLDGGAPQLIVHEMRNVGAIISRLKHLPKPTIAAVDGVAYGVGLGLALACDLIVASDRARFCQVFVKRGLALDGGSSWSLPRTVGARRARQLAYFGEPLGAAEALEWGLVNEVVAPDELLDVARSWGLRLASGPTTALSLIKRLIDEGQSSSFDQAIEAEARAQHIAFTTGDMREGIQAFLERREPRFTGS